MTLNSGCGYIVNDSNFGLYIHSCHIENSLIDTILWDLENSFVGSSETGAKWPDRGTGRNSAAYPINNKIPVLKSLRIF